MNPGGVVASATVLADLDASRRTRAPPPPPVIAGVWPSFPPKDWSVHFFAFPLTCSAVQERHPGRHLLSAWSSLHPAPTTAAAIAAHAARCHHTTNKSKTKSTPPPPLPPKQQFVVAFNCHTAALAAGGLSLLVPFFGGDDDIAALLLALAILERDPSAELVVLSFLEPKNPATGTGHGNGAGSEVSQSFGRLCAYKQVLQFFFFSSH